MPDNEEDIEQIVRNVIASELRTLIQEFEKEERAVDDLHAAVVVVLERFAASASQRPQSFKAVVADAGGGHVDLLIDRDTQRYPRNGQRVEVSYVPAEDPVEAVADRILGEFGVIRSGGGGSR